MQQGQMQQGQGQQGQMQQGQMQQGQVQQGQMQPGQGQEGQMQQGQMQQGQMQQGQMPGGGGGTGTGAECPSTWARPAVIETSTTWSVSHDSCPPYDLPCNPPRGPNCENSKTGGWSNPVTATKQPQQTITITKNTPAKPRFAKGPISMAGKSFAGIPVFI